MFIDVVKRRIWEKTDGRRYYPTEPLTTIVADDMKYLKKNRNNIDGAPSAMKRKVTTNSYLLTYQVP